MLSRNKIFSHAQKILCMKRTPAKHSHVFGAYEYMVSSFGDQVGRCQSSSCDVHPYSIFYTVHHSVSVIALCAHNKHFTRGCLSFKNFLFLFSNRVEGNAKTKLEGRADADHAKKRKRKHCPCEPSFEKMARYLVIHSLNYKKLFETTRCSSRRAVRQVSLHPAAGSSKDTLVVLQV